MAFPCNLLFVPKPVSESVLVQDWVTGKGKGRRATHKALCCWQWGLWALSRDPPRERSAAGPQLSPDGREQKGQQPRRGGLRAAGFVGIWRPRGTAPPRRVDKGLPPGLRGGRGTQPARSPASSGKWLRYPRGIATGRCYCPRRAAGGAARLPAPPRPLAAAVHTRRGAEPPARGPHTRAATGHAPTRPAPRRQPITRCETSARAGPASGLFHWRNRASLTACPAPPLTSAVGGGSGLLPTPLRGPNRQRRRGWPGAPPVLGPLSSPRPPAASPPSGHRAPGPSRGVREGGRGQRACARRREAV